MQRDQSNEVPVEAAYAAAQDRALKTTTALILAEAQTLTLSRRVQQLEDENTELRRLLEDATEPDVQEEVTHDATRDEVERTAAGGEADTAPPFSD